MITTEINGKTFEIDGKGFLSPAEELTLEDWLHDMRAQDAAQKRCRSAETVNTHRKNLREKTRQHSAVGVLAYCLSHGFIRVVSENGAREPLFCLAGELLKTSLTLNIPKSGPIDQQIFRAQARLRTRKGVVVSLGQKAVAPVFKEASAGEADYYEIPTYLRNRLLKKDADSYGRLSAWVEQVRAHVQEIAA